MNYFVMAVTTIILPYLCVYALNAHIGSLVIILSIIWAIWGAASIIRLSENKDSMEKYKILTNENNIGYCKEFNINNLINGIPFVSFLNSVIMLFAISYFGIMPMVIVNIITISMGIMYSVYDSKKIVKNWNTTLYDKFGKPNINILKLHVKMKVYQDIVLNAFYIIGFFIKGIAYIFNKIIGSMTYCKLISTAKGSELEEKE